MAFLQRERGPDVQSSLTGQVGVQLSAQAEQRRCGNGKEGGMSKILKKAEADS